MSMFLVSWTNRTCQRAARPAFPSHAGSDDRSPRSCWAIPASRRAGQRGSVRPRTHYIRKEHRLVTTARAAATTDRRSFLGLWRRSSSLAPPPSAALPQRSFAAGALMTGQNERPLRPAAALVVGIGRQPDGRVTIGLAAFAKEGDPLGLLLPPAALA